MKYKLRFLFALCATALLCSTAKADNYVDVTSTYLKNAGLTVTPLTTSDENGWTVTTNAAGSGTATGGTPSWQSGALEFYHTWGTGTALETSQTFNVAQSATLPAGTYKLSWLGFYREGLSASSAEGTTEKAYIYATDGTTTASTATDKTYLQLMYGTTENSLSDAASAFSSGTHANELTFTLDEETTIEIGFDGYISTAGSWCPIGPVTLYQNQSYYTQFSTLMEEAQTFLSNTSTSTDEITALNTAVTSTYASYTSSTDEESLSTAVTELTSLLTAAQKSILPDDGYYYIKSNESGRFLSVGSTWGTRAVTGDFGVAAYVLTSDDITTTFQLSTTGSYLYQTGSNVYCDQSSNSDWVLEEATGGYYIKRNGTSDYLYENSSDSYHLATGTTKTVFSFVTASEYVASLQTKDDALAAAAAEAAGITGITTESELAAYLADENNDASSSVTTVNSTDGQFYSSETGSSFGGSSELNISKVFSTETLEAGLYKIQAQGFARVYGYTDVAQTLHPNNADRPAIYLYAGDAKTCLMSMADVQQTTSYTGNVSVTVGDNTYSYPNSTTGAGEMFDAGYYADNVIYLYVSEDASVEIGLEGYTPSGRWTMYGDVTVTKYAFDNSVVLAELQALIEEAKVVAEDEISDEQYITALNELITTYSAYDEDNTKADIQTAITELQAAMDAVMASIVNSGSLTSRLTNPSFELNTDGTTLADDATLSTSNGNATNIYGWTEEGIGSSYNNTNIHISSSSLDGSFGSTSASEGNHYLFTRRAWDETTWTMTEKAITLPAGKYTLTADYKIEGYTSSGSFMLSANDASSNVLSSATVYSPGTGNTSYFADNDWSTLSVTYTLDESTAVNHVLTFYDSGSKRTDICVDNITLTKVAESVGDASVSLTSSKKVTCGKVITVTFPDAYVGVGNTASLLSTTASYSVNEGTSTGSLTLSSATDGFTFTIPSDLSVGDVITITIPAGVYGYSSYTNEALTLTYTIASSTTANGSWMSSLPDGLYLSELSLPGAHDAGTGEGFTSGLINSVAADDCAVTQELTLKEQFNAGVRVFDLRPSVDDEADGLRLAHGICIINKTFDSALEELISYVNTDTPTEFAVVIFRDEDDYYGLVEDYGDNAIVGTVLGLSSSSASADNFASLLASTLETEGIAEYLVDYNRGLTVGDLRGKILMLSRESLSNMTGGIVSGWSDKATNASATVTGLATQGYQIGSASVQDYYDTTAKGAVNTKKGYMKTLLDSSTAQGPMKEADDGRLYINHASAYSTTTDVKYLGVTIQSGVAASDGYRDNATYTNQYIIDYFDENEAGPAGFVMMDYVGEDASGSYNVMGASAIQTLVDNNIRYVERMNEEMYSELTAKLTTLSSSLSALSTSISNGSYSSTTALEAKVASIQSLIDAAPSVLSSALSALTLYPVGHTTVDDIETAINDLTMVLAANGSSVEMNSYMGDWKGNSGSYTANGTACDEFYRDYHFTSDSVMWQTIDNLPNGIYEVQVYCNASGANWNTTAVVDDGTTGCTEITANGIVYSLPVYNVTSVSTPNTITFSKVPVTDGTLKLNIYNKAQGANWIIVANKSLTYLGDGVVSNGKTLQTYTNTNGHDLDFSNVDVNAYIVTTENENSVTAEIVEDGDVPAGTGILIVNDVEAEIASGDTLVIPVTAGVADLEGNMLKGCTSAMTASELVTDNGYILVNLESSQQFQKVGASATGSLAAGKAYLSLPEGSEVNSFSIIWNSDAATGINSLDDAATEGYDPSEPMYNLMGIRISEPKGVFIQNGKKFIVK